jgi:hypothetical protein
MNNFFEGFPCKFGQFKATAYDTLRKTSCSTSSLIWQKLELESDLYEVVIFVVSVTTLSHLLSNKLLQHGIFAGCGGRSWVIGSI